MKIGILSDGKFGERAYEFIGTKFPVEFIRVPFFTSSFVDDLQLDIPKCDLYISYARHPDVARSIAEKGVPTILGVSFGPGFLRQVQEVNKDVIAPITMCSLENNTGIVAVDEYTRVFGKPLFKVEIENGQFEDILVLRGAPCGSTIAASIDLIGEPVTPETLRYFGIRICHYCRAPRFGKTCDKEVAGLLQMRELLEAIRRSNTDSWNQLQAFVDEVEGLYKQKLSQT
jgi:hypothetical protein